MDGTYLGPPCNYVPFDAGQLFVGAWDAIRRATERARWRIGVSVLLFDAKHRLLIDPTLNAQQAYAHAPARIFSDEEAGPYAPGPRLAGSRELHDGVTHAVSLLGPLAATRRLLDDDGDERARLTLGGAGMAVTRSVGPSALQHGILGGRYSRCDVRTGQDSLELSRVHAIILEEPQVLRLDQAKEVWLSNARDDLGLQWEEG